MQVSGEDLLTRGRDAADALASDPEVMGLVRDLLMRWYPTAMWVLLGLTLAALLVAIPALSRGARAVPARFWIAALLVTNLALSLRLFWAPHMPQVYHDEIFFLNTADNMARHGVNGLSSVEGEVPGPGFHACPVGWQFLVSLAYRVGGVRPALAFDLAAVLSGLSVLLLALLVRGLLDDDAAGIAAGLLLAVLPVHLRLSGSAALETSSLFFLLAGLLALSGWMRGGGGALLPLAALLLAWFANTRMENAIALAPLVFLVFLVLCPSERLRGWGSRLLLLGCAVVVILGAMPALLADFYGLASRFYYFYASNDVIQNNVRANLSGNFRFFVDDRFHPLAFTILAVIGLVAGVRRGGAWRQVALLFALWWGALTLFYSLNPSCDFSLRHTLDSWRTALHPTLGILVLGSMGVAALMPARPRTVGLGFAALCVLVPLAFASFVQTRHLWMVQWEAQSEMRDLVRPEDYVLVHDEGGLGPRSLSLFYEMALTMGVTPRFFLVDNGPRPQIQRDVSIWAGVEKRRVFLYHLHTGTVVDEQRLALLERTLTLRAVAGRTARRNRHTFSLYRVDGSAVATETKQ